MQNLKKGEQMQSNTKPYPGQTTQTSMVPKILGAFPWHDEYHEVFAGTCQMLKRKVPVKVSHVVDLNSKVVLAGINSYTAGKITLPQLQCA